MQSSGSGGLRLPKHNPPAKSTQRSIRLDLAEFYLASSKGAILRMKVARDPAALERFKKIAFETVFNKTDPIKRN